MHLTRSLVRRWVPLGVQGRYALVETTDRGYRLFILSFSDNLSCPGEGREHKVATNQSVEPNWLDSKNPALPLTTREPPRVCYPSPLTQRLVWTEK